MNDKFDVKGYQDYKANIVKSKKRKFLFVFLCIAGISFLVLLSILTTPPGEKFNIWEGLLRSLHLIVAAVIFSLPIFILLIVIKTFTNLYSKKQ